MRWNSYYTCYLLRILKVTLANSILRRMELALLTAFRQKALRQINWDFALSKSNDSLLEWNSQGRTYCRRSQFASLYFGPRDCSFQRNAYSDTTTSGIWTLYLRQQLLYYNRLLFSRRKSPRIYFVNMCVYHCKGVNRSYISQSVR